MCVKYYDEIHCFEGEQQGVYGRIQREERDLGGAELYYNLKNNKKLHHFILSISSK